MSLPAQWTDKIFAKLSLIYGREFTGRWEGMNICDVKSDWSHELDGYEKRPKAISWALQNLPHDRPPTVLEFRRLCNTLPQEATVFIDAPKADPQRVKAAMAKLSDAPPDTHGLEDGIEWARRIVRRKEAGEKIVPYSFKLALSALALERPGGASPYVEADALRTAEWAAVGVAL
jgi:hypothetical protein